MTGRRKRRHRPSPRQNPKQGGKTEDEEDRLPTPVHQDQAACERSDGRPKGKSSRHRRIGNAAPFGRNMPGDDLRTAGKGDAFADPKHDPEYEERGESPGKSH